MYDHVNKVCNFKLFNWTKDCSVAMSLVFHEYNKIDIYNIYAPKCNTPKKTSSSVAEVSHITMIHYQVMNVRNFINGYVIVDEFIEGDEGKISSRL